MPLSTVQIQEALLKNFFDFHQHKYCCSNFEGCGYDQADVLTVNKTMYVFEFEVKISRGDFRNDFKKTSKHWHYSKGLFDKSVGDKKVRVPNKFYYACPPGLIQLDEVPIYAGLVYVSGFTLLHEQIVQTKVKVIKPAPFLHKTKADPQLIFRMCQTLSARTIFGCALQTFKNRRNKAMFNK